MEKDKNIEHIVKEALIKLKQKEGIKTKGRCLTDLEMASLLDGQVPPKQRTIFLKHILSCKKCAYELKDDLSILENIEKDTTDIPQDWIQEAVEIVTQRPKPFHQKLQDNLKKITLIIRRPLQLISQYSYVPVSAMVLVVVIFAFLVISSFYQPLKIVNFNVLYIYQATTQLEPIPSGILKIELTTNYDCYAYLFGVKDNKIQIFIEEEHILKDIYSKIPSKINKSIPREGKLILILSEAPLRNISFVTDLIIKNYYKNDKEILKILKKKLKDLNISVKSL